MWSLQSYSKHMCHPFQRLKLQQATRQSALRDAVPRSCKTWCTASRRSAHGRLKILPISSTSKSDDSRTTEPGIIPNRDQTTGGKVHDLMDLEELQLASENASEGPIDSAVDTTEMREASSHDMAATPVQTAANMIITQWHRLCSSVKRMIASAVALLSWIPTVARHRKLKKLKGELQEHPLAPDKRANYARALNKSGQHQDVMRLWEGSKGEGATNDALTVEYLQAVVKTGHIMTYVADSSTKSGSNQASLSDFLQHCQERLDGKDAQLPGNSALKPLHVIMQSAAQQPRQSWAGKVLQLFMSFILVPTIWLMFLVAGWLAIKSSLPSTAIASAPGTTAAGPISTGTMFAPKEYNKDTVPEKSKKTFADVRGCDEAKAEVTEIVEFLKQPDRFTRLGGKLPKGVLLTGPPGTGKTLLAKAIAGEAGVPFFFRSGSEFDEMLVGVGSLRVRTLFAAAKKAAPCIVFIDEIDAIGQARSNAFESGSAKTLNQLLVEMDGFETNEGVVVIAATNLEHKLDAALTRPGRFDREVAVPLPDVRGRLDIIEYYLKGKPIGSDVDPQILARRTPGFSGADLSNMINEAALSAAKNCKDSITAQTLDEARDKILMGSPRMSMVQTMEARRLTAFHEAGHALVALNTPGATPIHKATIVPRGHALGMVSMVPHQDEYSITRRQMRAGIDVSMGGRVAEELIFGEDHVTSGATSDLKQATKQARHMVMECGMSNEIGPVYIPEEKSAETRRIIDVEVTGILKDAHSRVTKMLREKQADLEKLAQALLVHETLTAREIQQVLCGNFEKEPVARKEAQSDVAALLGPNVVQPELREDSNEALQK